MKAIFKDNKRLLVREIKKDDIVMLNAFVDKFRTYEVVLTELMDVDNNLDGVNIIVTDELRNKISYKLPMFQILFQGMGTTVDLEIDSETNLVIHNPYDDIIITNNAGVLTLYAIDKPELRGTTKQYTAYITLTKEGCEQTTVPLNITVIYQENKPINYEDLVSLPKINDITVVNNKSLEDYGIQEEMDILSNRDINDMMNNIFN